MFQLHALDIAHIIIIVLIYLIAIPLIIYYTYKLYQSKKFQIVSFRDPLLVLCLNILIVSNFVSDRTPKAIVYAIQIEDKYPRWIQQLFSGISSWGIINLLSIKCYLLFFKQRYHTAIQNQIWAKHIDDNWNNWYIRNKHKWGSFRYILKYIFIPYIIECIINAFGELIFGHTFITGFTFLGATIPTLLILIFATRLGRFYDIFGIRKEILAQCLTFIVCIPIYFTIITISKALTTDQVYIHIYNITATILIAILFTMLAISSSLYPLFLVQKHEKQQQNAVPCNNIDIVCNRATTAGLIQSIKDYQIFCFLMNHLVKEFATESLLFILELCQIKNEYQISQYNVIKVSNRTSMVLCNLDVIHDDKQSPDINGKDEYVVIDFNIDTSDKQLPLTLPATDSNQTPTLSNSVSNSVSYLVNSSTPSFMKHRKDKPRYITTYIFGEHYTADMIKIEFSTKLPKSEILKLYPNDSKKQLKALYHKYIEEGSSQEINVSFDIRSNLKQFVNKINDEDICEGDLFWSFDECCLEILWLLLAPYKRFISTQKYSEYINCMEMTDIYQQQQIDNNNKPKIYSGMLYDQIYQKYMDDK